MAINVIIHTIYSNSHNTYKFNTMKTNLEKLQNLCEIVNIRYSKGLNDDDQVAKMFEFERKQKDDEE